MTQFLQKFDELLEFLNFFKQDVSIIGEFDIDTLKHHQDGTNYENLLTAYDLDVHVFEPT